MAEVVYAPEMFGWIVLVNGQWAGGGVYQNRSQAMAYRAHCQDELQALDELESVVAYV